MYVCALDISQSVWLLKLCLYVCMCVCLFVYATVTSDSVVTIWNSRFHSYYLVFLLFATHNTTPKYLHSSQTLSPAHERHWYAAVYANKIGVSGSLPEAVFIWIRNNDIVKFTSPSKCVISHCGFLWLR